MKRVTAALNINTVKTVSVDNAAQECLYLTVILIGISKHDNIVLTFTSLTVQSVTIENKTRAERVL